MSATKIIKKISNPRPIYSFEEMINYGSSRPFGNESYHLTTLSDGFYVDYMPNEITFIPLSPTNKQDSISPIPIGLKEFSSTLPGAIK
jgi:hypothetical protein